MNTAARSALDTWVEFAAAVEFVADLERPDLNVWDALAEAVSDWLDPDHARPIRPVGGDPLRQLLRQVADSTPEAGAPGGVPFGAALDAVMSAWVEACASRLNDGHPFTR